MCCAQLDSSKLDAKWCSGKTQGSHQATIWISIKYGFMMQAIRG